MTYGTVTSTPFVTAAPAIGATVSLIPGSGNTSKCEYSLTETAISHPGTANWFLSSSGITSVPWSDVMDGKAVALRFTRVSGTNPDQYEIIG